MRCDQGTLQPKCAATQYKKTWSKIFLDLIHLSSLIYFPAVHVVRKRCPEYRPAWRDALHEAAYQEERNYRCTWPRLFIDCDTECLSCCTTTQYQRKIFLNAVERIFLYISIFIFILTFFMKKVYKQPKRDSISVNLISVVFYNIDQFTFI